MGRPKGSKNKKYTALGIDAKSKEWLGYRDHRNSAKPRGIPFLLTFPEWVSIWKTSGKFHLRGRENGCYVMARRGDKGAYEIGNVEIISHEENSSAPHWGRPITRSKEWRQKHSEFMKVYVRTKKGRAQSSAAGKLGAAARWGKRR